MPSVIINKEALLHNARLTKGLMERWGIKVLPILKAMGSHPLLVEVLGECGFFHFGYAEIEETKFFSTVLVEKTLIQLTPPSKAFEVVDNFQRSFQTVPETMAIINKVAASKGQKHEVLLMVDIGDHREGLNIEEIPEILAYALTLPSVRVTGFGSTTTCLGSELPNAAMVKKLQAIKKIFQIMGIEKPEVSLGGTVWADWLEKEGSGIITELRLGDPFILGEDIYRQQDLPGGSFRQDVCFLEAEVLEIRERNVECDNSDDSDDSEKDHPHHLEGMPIPPRKLFGLRRRALLDLGRFHTGSDFVFNDSNSLNGFRCCPPGMTITGISAGYLILDITDCPEPPEVGQTVFFHPRYWTIASACRNPSVSLRLESKFDGWKKYGLPKTGNPVSGLTESIDP